MSDKTKKQTPDGSRGYWFTTEKGQHLFAKEGETPKEACERYYAERETKEEKLEALRRKVDGGAPAESENEYSTQSDVERLYGEEFKGYKGQAAIEKLLKEQRGHVKGAFHRDDMGDIDLVWGSDTVGLQHIIKQREKQGVDLSTFLGGLSEVVEMGRFIQKNGNGTFEFWHEGKMAVITPEYHGQRVTFLLTAYKRTKPPRV